MIDWEDVIRANGPEELREAKVWLFKENIRLQNEKKNLEEMQEKISNERMRYRREIEELNSRTLQERKRLKDETQFFDKKMAILQNGFRQLEEDRKGFEREKLRFEREKAEFYLGCEETGENAAPENAAILLFRGVSNNPLALRKRYRELVKIFHPDNSSGDEEVVQLINKEYQRRKMSRN